MAKMASIEARVRRCLELQREYDRVANAGRWSARAMIAPAHKYYPPERLQALADAIAGSPDPGSLPQLRERLITQLFERYAQHYRGFLSPKHISGFLRMYPRSVPMWEDDLARFGTSKHEFYCMVLTRLATTRTEVFGANDDPEGNAARAEELRAEIAALRDSLDRVWTSDDMELRQVSLPDGTRLYAQSYRMTGGAINAGDVDGLLGWARAHLAEVT